MRADERRKVYLDNGINEVNVTKIIANRNISDYLNKFIDKCNLVIASNLLLGDIQAYLNKMEYNYDDTKLTDDKFVTLVNYMDKGKISSKQFKDIIEDIMEEDLSIDEILDKHGFKEMDSSELDNIIKTVMDNNPQSVSDYKSGNERAIKFLMGQIMKETKGNANPQLVTEKLTEALNK